MQVRQMRIQMMTLVKKKKKIDSNNFICTTSSIYSSYAISNMFQSESFWASNTYSSNNNIKE